MTIGKQAFWAIFPLAGRQLPIEWLTQIDKEHVTIYVTRSVTKSFQILCEKTTRSLKTWGWVLALPPASSADLDKLLLSLRLKWMK